MNKKTKVTFALAIALMQFACFAAAEEEPMYVICMPKDRVNIRLGPSRSSSSVGWCEAGDIVYYDGKTKNGYRHCVGLGVEAGEGWIHKGYLVYDPVEYVNADAMIVSKSRLAARKYINGKRTRWLKPGGVVRIYYWTNEWALTNCGYVQSAYLELNGE